MERQDKNLVILSPHPILPLPLKKSVFIIMHFFPIILISWLFLVSIETHGFKCSWWLSIHCNYYPTEVQTVPLSAESLLTFGPGVLLKWPVLFEKKLPCYLVSQKFPSSFHTNAPQTLIKLFQDHNLGPMDVFCY